MYGDGITSCLVAPFLPWLGLRNAVNTPFKKVPGNGGIDNAKGDGLGVCFYPRRNILRTKAGVELQSPSLGYGQDGQPVEIHLLEIGESASQY